MSNASRIAHEGLPFAHPMSEAAVDEAISELSLPPNPLIFDSGCGNGQMLLRTMRRNAPARGLGVDLDEGAIVEVNRSVGDLDARFEVGDAAGVMGPFDAVINVAASHLYGDFRAALVAFKSLAPVILYGEGYWAKPPSQAFLDALGGATIDELEDHGGLRRAIQEAGFTVAHEWLATEQDWAHYEETLAENAERHDAPDTRSYAARIRDRRALPGGTDTLGFALMILRA